MTILMLLVLFPLAAPQEAASRQDEAVTAQQVIDRFVAAKGGETNLRKIENYVFEGVVDIDGQETYQMKVYQAPGRHLTVITASDGSERRHGTDGKTVWQVDFDGTARILEGDEAKEYLRHNTTVHEALAWSSQYDQIDYVERTVFDDRPVHHLRFRGAGQPEIHRYFDVESGLFVRETQELDEDPPIRMDARIEDYEPLADGGLVSRKRVVQFDSTMTVEYRLNKIRGNGIDDPSVFDLPEAVKALLKRLP